MDTTYIDLMNEYYSKDLWSQGVRLLQYVHDTAATMGNQPTPPRRDLVATWVKKGKANWWIAEAYDPPFTAKSIHVCEYPEELAMLFSHGNWNLGCAFALGNICFINQVDGGDEWLVIKDNLPFESASCGLMLKTGTFFGWLSDIQAATLEQCKKLEY